MSLLLLTLALLAAQSSPPQPSSNEPDRATTNEIVVTAQRLRDFRGSVKIKKKTGEPFCRMTRSSGDRALDERFCAAMVDCHGTVAHSVAITAARDAGVRQKELERIWVAEATTCMRPFFKSLGLD